MYRGLIRIKLIGSHPAFDVIEHAQPVGPFQHEVLHEEACASEPREADLVIVAADGPDDGAAIQHAASHRTSSAQVIAIVPAGAFDAIAPVADGIDDIWTAPLSAEEAAFRFKRWQERYKASMDSWESAQFLEMTINSIPCLVWYKTADGVHEKVNDSFCETVNKPKDDVEGRRHAYIWDVEEDDPACIESEAKVMSTRQTCVSEELVKSGDDMRLLTTYKSPLYNPDGSVMGTVGVAIDITQERAYERDLVEKNQTLETIFMSMECGVLTHSLDGSRVIGANQAALSILGYETVEDMLSDGFDMVASSVVEEDREMIRERLQSLVHVGDSTSMEYRVRHDDGTIVHVMGNIKLIEKDGELLYQRFLLDNSEQKHAEEVRERRHQALIRALSEDYTAVCSFDVDTGDGELLRLSADVQRLADVFEEPLSLERTLGGYLEHSVLDEDTHLLEPLLTREGLLGALDGVDRVDIHYRTNEQDEQRYCQATVVKAGTWDGNDRHVVVGLRNVDAQTREEMEQKQLLMEALSQAERASQAKTTFLSNMSHDIRTPMNAIVGFSTLASSRIDDPEKVREYLDKIHASSTHLLSLINDILDMSRIESGKVTLDEQLCSIAEIIEELSAIIEPQAEAKGLTFSMSVQGLDDALVLVDKLKLEQILLNLLSNAVKFTDEGGQVELKAEEITGAPSECKAYRITVRDDGIGMTEGFLQHIFDPFERERTSTVSGIQGTGLGMAISKRLVDMMGGRIEAASKKGEGSEFTVTLTLHIGADEAVAEEEAPQEEFGAMRAAYQGYRVLLVDDNFFNREIATTLLGDAGFVVDVAEDGRDALEKLTAAPPDTYRIVLMDIQMPVMNGYDATRAIRALEDERLANIPVLAVTADAFEEDRQKALAAGMNGHLAKPIQVEELFRALDRILG